MNFFNNIIKLSLVSTFFLITNVNAATTTWEWSLNAGAGSDGTSTISSTGTNSSDTTTSNANLSAWSDTGNNDKASANYDTKLEAGSFYYYSGGGWGIVNQDNESGTPEHAFDNKQKIQEHACLDGYSHSQYYDDKCYNRVNGQLSYVDDLTLTETDYDMVLVSFDTSIELTEINFGWIYDDADFTVLALKDTANIATTARNSWADVAGSGDWITVGNYDANNTGYYSIEDNRHTSSQYWLIGAYNSIFGSTSYDQGNLSESNTDAFKIKKLKGVTSVTPPPEEVPAPTAFGLLLIGALGIYARRNKKTA